MSPPVYDLVLRGGILLDGTGQNRRMADVSIKDDRIAAIGRIGKGQAYREIDVRRKCVAPGFIDSHTHDDRACIHDPAMSAKVSQGVTTVVVGNCGMSLAPLNRPREVPEPFNLLGRASDFTFPDFNAYFNAVNSARPKTNVVALVGHNTLRLAAMKHLDRRATAKEMVEMTGLLRRAMQAGAAGLSSGLYYAPGKAADNIEICPLVRVVSNYRGIYASHVRDEYDGVLNSMKEALDAAKAGPVPLVISHHKCAGPRNWGRSAETLSFLNSELRRHEINLDCYPYTAGSSVLDPELVEDGVKILVTWSESYPNASGRYLDQIAKELGCSQREAAQKLRRGGACYFQMAEKDVRSIIRHPATMIGSDGLPDDPHPHPRLWGTFPRVIRRYALEQKLFSLEEAIRKMTSLPAHRFKLGKRGALLTGNYADIVVFDPRSISDRASYKDPKQASSGIEYVFVNGQISWQNGEMPGTGAGRALRLKVSK